MSRDKVVQKRPFARPTARAAHLIHLDSSIKMAQFNPKTTGLAKNPTRLLKVDTFSLGGEFVHRALIWLLPAIQLANRLTS